ncbi:hypothetical protein ABMA27_015026 [Loxostege sticticalis]|uniref:Uncharacterized protein n=1 Tax=Loxostege sticticalis TaxID=481309 RepID=A0ABR3IB05_LOXSC
MDSDSEEELILLTAATVCCHILTKKQERKQWMKEWLKKRNQFTHINLLNELTLEPSDWRNYLRMDETTYFKLLKLVTPYIAKRDTNMREAISPHERLTATLRFLASGMSYEELKFPTAISPQRLGVIIPETCKAILRVLKDYMKHVYSLPRDHDNWCVVWRIFIIFIHLCEYIHRSDTVARSEETRYSALSVHFILNTVKKVKILGHTLYRCVDTDSSWTVVKTVSKNIY